MTKRRHALFLSLALCAAVGMVAVWVFAPLARPTEGTAPVQPEPVLSMAAPEQRSEASTVAGSVDSEPITISRSSYPGTWKPEEQAQGADIIVLGTVKEVLPARWNTADGKRPPGLGRGNEPPGTGIIYSPVILEVERYLKNPQAERSVTLFMLGGSVGQDRMASSDTAQFLAGERVLVFLGPAARRNDGVTARAVNEKYGIAANGESRSSNNPTISMPLSELMARTQSAVAK